MNVEIPITPEALTRAEQIADRHMAYYATARNTLTLAASHRDGLVRGFVGEWAAACWYGSRWLASIRPPGQDYGYDVLRPDGVRVDVKTAKVGAPLMVPVKQRYKLDHWRLDLLLLAWWDGEPTIELVGEVTPERFLEAAHEESRVVSTLVMDHQALAPLGGAAVVAV